MALVPIFFDLDGTLIDSKLDLANSVNATLHHFGMKEIDNQTIYGFVGNGVRQLIVDTLNERNRPDIFDEFYRYFLNHYSLHLLDNTKLYPGTEELLKELSREFALYVVTNKSEAFATKILKGLGVAGYFKEIVGGDTFPNKKPHPEPVLKLAEKWGFEPRGKLMVGDSENDMLLADKLGMVSVWVSYGFRDRSSLKSYRVDYTIDRPLELLEVVKKWKKTAQRH